MLSNFSFQAVSLKKPFLLITEKIQSLSTDFLLQSVDSFVEEHFILDPIFSFLRYFWVALIYMMIIKDDKNIRQFDQE